MIGILYMVKKVFEGDHEVTSVSSVRWLYVKCIVPALIPLMVVAGSR